MTLSPRAIEAAASAIANFHATGVPNGWSQAQIDKAEAQAAITAYLAVDGLCLVQGWHPIETAPKDGTWVLVSAHNLHACDAQWSSDAYENVGWFDGSGFFSTQPTHWCPLPMIAAASDGEDRVSPPAGTEG